jgi:hypothetical protein
MINKTFYTLLIVVLSLVVFSCSEEKKEDDPAEKEEKTEEVEAVANEFFSSLMSNNFQYSKGLVTKASYSSVNFLSKVSYAFVSVYFEGVESCEVEENKATCICEFGYYGENRIQREITLEKFEEEWLIDFRLGENFDNIFLYNYGYSEVEETEGAKLSLDPATKDLLKDQVVRFTSSSVKVGFSTPEDIAAADLNYDGGTTYGTSEYDSELLTISTAYDFDDGRLSSAYVTIDNQDYEQEAAQYFEDIYKVMTSQLGTPFNLPNNPKVGPEDVMELRWFVKGYNEILILTNRSSYIQLTLQETE